MEDRAEQGARRAIGAAIEVHRTLGPGYLESVYQLAMEVELTLRGIAYQRQRTFELDYKGRAVGEGRLDFMVEECLVVELKSIDALSAVHMAQAISYLKATGLPLALLINFNVPVLVEGLRRGVL